MSEIAKIGLAGSGVVVALINKKKATVSQAATFSHYEQTYGHIIKSSFENQKLRRQLLSALQTYNRDELKKAIKKLLRLKRHCVSQDDLAVVYFFIAKCYNELSEVNKAIHYYELAINHRTYFENAISNLGTIYYEINQFDQAQMYFEKVIYINPEYLYANVNLGHVYLEQQKYDEAIEMGKKALKLSPKLKQALQLLSVSYASKGDIEQAQTYLQQYEQCGYDNKDVISNLVQNSYEQSLLNL